jgi:hypothetical protein
MLACQIGGRCKCDGVVRILPCIQEFEEQMGKSRQFAFMLPIAAVVAGLSAPAARAETFSSSYAVSVLGLTVGASQFKATIEGKKIRINGNVRSSGLVRIFDDTTGSTSVVAHLGKSGIVPVSYDLNYVSGNKKKRTTISFSGGDAVKVSNSPAVKKHGDYIELSKGDLVSVFDPIAAGMFRASGPDDVCNRTVRVFDGETRADLKLTPAGTEAISTNGFAGTGVRCNVRFKPVAGYKADTYQIKYLRDNSRITAVFAPVGSTGLWAPVKAEVGTQIGPVRIFATQFASSN